ncbi:MAG: DUF554 domain-containing protein [Bacillota bacterium]
MTGTLINVTTVVVGAVCGTALGTRLPEGMRSTIMDGLGLITTLIGLSMGLKTQNILVVLGSVVLGGILGEMMGIDRRLSSLAERLQKALGGINLGKGRFSEGFMTASLVFCVGPMTIMGSIQDGLTGDFSTLAVKSALDGFASVAFAASLGIGVAFSALFILVYQGGITLLASWASSVLTDAMVVEMAAVGGVLISGIGLGLLDIKKVRVANLLPAIFIAPFLAALAGRL